MDVKTSVILKTNNMNLVLCKAVKELVQIFMQLWEILSKENVDVVFVVLIHDIIGLKTEGPSCTVFTLNLFPSSTASNVHVNLSIKHDSYLHSLGEMKGSGSIIQTPFTEENGKEDRQSMKKAYKFLYSGLSVMLSYGKCTNVHAAIQMCVWAPRTELQ